MRLRLRFSPLDSRVASLGEVFAAALAVAGRSASGRITMPLPSPVQVGRSWDRRVRGVSTAIYAPPESGPAYPGRPSQGHDHSTLTQLCPPYTATETGP